MAKATTRVVNPGAIVLAVTLEMTLGEWLGLRSRIGTDTEAGLVFARAVGDAAAAYTEQATSEIAVEPGLDGTLDSVRTPGQKAP